MAIKTADFENMKDDANSSVQIRAAKWLINWKFKIHDMFFLTSYSIKWKNAKYEQYIKYSQRPIVVFLNKIWIYCMNLLYRSFE